MSTSTQAAFEPAARFDVNLSATAVALGVAFWLAAALFIHYAEPAGLLSGVPRIIAFAVTIPLMWRAVRLVQQLVPRPACQAMPAVLIVTTTAMLCDVIALTWFPQIYAPEPRSVLSGVILILWGVMWALGFALWRATRVAA